MISLCFVIVSYVCAKELLYNQIIVDINIIISNNIAMRKDGFRCGLIDRFQDMAILIMSGPSSTLNLSMLLTVIPLSMVTGR